MTFKSDGIAVEPLVVSIATAVHISGISRAALYRRLAAGQITAVKNGRRTLINMASLKAYISTMPQANFRTAAEAK